MRALAHPGFRLWMIGCSISNVGAAMHRIAQDWLVLTGLEGSSTLALGVVAALQFLPSAIVTPFVGHLAARVRPRTLLLAVQIFGLLLTATQAALQLTGVLTLPTMYVFALGLGLYLSVDAPLRQAIVSDLLPERDVPQGIALTALSFTFSQFVGPGLAGVLISTIGIGMLFAVNALSFTATIGALLVVRKGLAPDGGPSEPNATRGGYGEVLRRLRQRGGIGGLVLLLIAVSSIGMQFPITSAVLVDKDFGAGSEGYGLVASAMAVGSVLGSLIAARMSTHSRMLPVLFGCAYAVLALVAAVSPTMVFYAVVMVPLGASIVLFTTSVNVTMQMAVPPAQRAHAASLYLTIFLGTVPPGSLFVGWVSDEAGARWGIAIGGIAAIAAAGVALLQLAGDAQRQRRGRRDIGIPNEDPEASPT
jgi:MFS family permease